MGAMTTTNSRDVAAFFNREHKTVLAKIKVAGCSAEFTQQNFLPSAYLDSTGRSLPSVDMTKDGFVFLVMGFTGAKAASFKEAYISRFNEMEAGAGKMECDFTSIGDHL